MTDSGLRLKIAMSLDGFVAGPKHSVQNPLGIGGMRLHQRAFPLAAWRAWRQDLQLPDTAERTGR